MNKIQLIGNITSDVVKSQTRSGQIAVRFTVATNQLVNGDMRTDFIPCVVFGKLAETCAKYLFKGAKVYVCGNLHIELYNDSKGGKRLGVNAIVLEVEFLTSQKQRASAKAVNDFEGEDEQQPKKKEVPELDMQDVREDDESYPF